MLEKYSEIAGLSRTISPHQVRHFLFTWLKKKGIDDALFQPYPGHENCASLEIYSKLSLSDVQDSYDDNKKISLFKVVQMAAKPTIFSPRPNKRYSFRLLGNIPMVLVGLGLLA